MRVAFGVRAHSGWAALVVLGQQAGDFVLVDRRRMELVDDVWAKAPYHAAEELQPAAARTLVERGVEQAHRIAVREMRAAVKRERDRGNDVTACGVPVSAPLPGWTTDEILAVHFRMHKAEGVLFRDVLVHAAEECGITPVPIPEKVLAEHADRSTIAAMGKSAGPPWGKDQKDAALAAAIALRKR